MVAIFLVPVAGSAAEYRVTSAEAVAAASSNARPGDLILMEDGIWKDADILFEAEGTAEQPIRLRAQTPGKVVLTGRSRLRVAGSHLVVEGLWFKEGDAGTKDVLEMRANTSKHAHHCRVTNCAISDYNPTDRETENKWISLYGTHNRVDHCALVGKRNAGQSLVVWLSGKPNYHQVDHNYFGPRPELGSNGGETVRVGTSEWSMSDFRTVVEYNLFQECNGEVEVVSNKACENVYRYNTFVDCEGALTLRHGNRCGVYGNFFFGNHKRRTGGVRIIGEDHKVYNNYFEGLEGDGTRSALSMMHGIPNSPLHGYFQVKRAVVAFNTFVDCRATMLLGIRGSNPEGGRLPPEDCLIANNLVQSSHGPLVQAASAPIDLRWKSNLMHGANLGIEPADGIRQEDPKLRRAADGLWRPAADSIALGQADDGFPFVTDDIDGQPRGSKPDIGCDQASAAATTRQPLTRAMVGPSWHDSSGASRF
jgi:poly(beta-D-mannuronate) lyase